jgi:hypothetical protein
MAPELASDGGNVGVDDPVHTMPLSSVVKAALSALALARSGVTPAAACSGAANAVGRERHDVRRSGHLRSGLEADDCCHYGQHQSMKPNRFKPHVGTSGLREREVNRAQSIGIAFRPDCRSVCNTATGFHDLCSVDCL